MSDLYITGIQYVDMPSAECKVPRDRFVNYYNNLYNLYKKTVSPETFLQGGQYSFAELGQTVLDICQQNGWLNNLDLLMSAHWAYDFDPDYSSCGSYFCHHYQLNCDLLEVCGQGTLASFTALHLLQKCPVKKSIVLVLEQTTTPRNLNDRAVIPTRNGGCALLLQHQLPVNQKAAFKLIDSIVFDTAELHLSAKTNIDIVMDILSKKSLLKENIHIITRKNSVIWKQIRMKINQGDPCLSALHFKHFSPDPSLLTTMRFLSDFKSDQSSYIVIIDEDVESLNCGVLILYSMYKS